MAKMKLATVSVLVLAALAGPASALDLPFGLGGGDRAPVVAREHAPVLMAQVGDGGVRISQMEEEMRRLTGKVEELSFLVLQLQEQLRKTQEDNEFRFQDLEGKGSGAAAKPAERRTDAAPNPVGNERVASAAPPSVNDASRAAPATAAPQTDEIGALLGNGDTSLNEPTPPPSTTGSNKVASIATNGPVEMYSLGYNYMLAGDYQLAENTFRQYTQAYPSSQDAADAQYWLGEALYAQNKYRDAAEVFLNAQKEFPKSAKAPEMMLKLGMSLARLNNRETACVTYAEVGKRYPDMSANVKRKLQSETKSASCA
ncbi:tol-pal system protein YbgF [Aureimonas phyllosphaerae]|uniref:Cell division coordinator CpoB n=1 Tax=Aureimonas phyllosphaerae TaxID=1166078 RepID=A0A7W6FT75_9HYPH|nr:tol-pal system protein YbgF [Aureimonas phyllosphaerae]MBB3934425.1 tol-pal system protein YbgF [Aureimonas phyllosphaerae]MBB3958359.1 tol-pal system protein YbgF [Aureimonas phyllosphaerae]SFE95861.1 tol-pal system protein YbgF [Aureimonas phyllosphaerae]